MLLNDETTRVSADEKRRLGGRRLWVGTVALALAVFGAVTGPVAPAQAAPTEVTTITQLADAMSNANDGETLVVQADISGAESDPDVEVKAGAGVTLDLNGYVVTIVGSLPASPEVLGSGHPGIWVPASSSLTIVDTSTDGGGTLNATGAGWSAGIGGNYAAPGGRNSGAITIASGSVHAIASLDGAGIGGADSGAGGRITISGGDVYAESLQYGSGIGSGARGSSSLSTDIVIDEATVEATSAVGAGIGGNGEMNITITDATVTASSASTGAGIGSWYNNSPSAPLPDIMIIDSIVTATGGNGGAGIGGGQYSPNGTVAINGGTIVATGTLGGAGIGGGASYESNRFGNGGVITINSGDVTATGGMNAAGMGGGAGRSAAPGGSGETIVINGGDVTAVGGERAAGIGGGAGGNSATAPAGAGGVVSIVGGNVTAVGGSQAPGIGGGHGSNFAAPGGAGADLTIGVGASVTASATNSEAIGGGLGFPLGDFGSLSNAGTLTLPDANTLVVPTGKTALNSGVLYNSGSISVLGELDNAGVIRNEGSISINTGGGVINSGAVVDSGAIADISLVTEHNVALTLNASGGSPVPVPNFRVLAASFNDAEVPFPADATRTGHLFEGWYTGPQGTGTPVTAATDLGTGGPKELTLYAKWSAPIEYLVSFDSTGGSSFPGINVPYGDPLPALPRPTQEGFEFMGWFTAATDGTKVVEGDIVTGQMVLYAQWATAVPTPPAPARPSPAISVTGSGSGALPYIGSVLLLVGAVVLIWRKRRTSL